MYKDIDNKDIVGNKGCWESIDRRKPNNLFPYAVLFVDSLRYKSVVVSAVIIQVFFLHSATKRSE